MITSRRVRWAGHIARMGTKSNAYIFLVGKADGKRPLRKPRHRRENNVKMDLREIALSRTDWINLAPDRDQ
jgi:hypothetical protein